MTLTDIEYDDSYILQKHKKILAEAIKLKLTSDPDYNSYDDTMLSVLCMDMYAKTINGMNKEQYLREIEEEDEKKNMLFKIEETPHISGVVVENKETDYYVKNEGDELSSPTDKSETNN